MATAGLRLRGNPDKMPGQYKVYAILTLLGLFVSVTILVLLGRPVGQLLALAGLPAFAGAPLAGGAIYRGVLDGPIETTPLGRQAVVWIGVVTRTTRQGKGTYTVEKCRLGGVTGLSLVVEGQRWSIGAPDLRAIELELGLRPGQLAPTRYWLGAPQVVSPLPDAIVARCRIDRDALAKGDWSYAEHVAPPGAVAELAGCATGDVLGSCGASGSGVALGHLSTPGLRAMRRRMADGAMVRVTPLIFLMMLFPIVGVAGAVLALRAAAPPDLIHAGRQE